MQLRSRTRVVDPSQGRPYTLPGVSICALNQPLMAYTIESAGLLTTGTTGADKFTLQSGGIKRASIAGLAGNDTILVEAPTTSAKSASLDAAGDKDTITISGGTWTKSTIAGGAGADDLKTNTFTDFTASVLKAGDGNDTITFSGGVAAASTILGGGGSTP